MEKLEELIIDKFGIIILLFSFSWLGLIAYGLINQ